MYNPTQRLMRSRTDKIIAGVAGGVGELSAPAWGPFAD